MNHVDDLDQYVLPLSCPEKIVYYLWILPHSLTVHYRCISQHVPKLPNAIKM